MAELSEVLNSKSLRTKRRRIHDNVEKVISEMSCSNADSTYLATASDGGGHTELAVDHENMTRVYTLDAVSEQTPDLPLMVSNESFCSHTSYTESSEACEYVAQSLSSVSDSSDKSDCASI